MECSMLAFVAVLKSAEAMHRFLLGNMHRARARHESVRSRVHRAVGADQLAALQLDLWRFDTDAVSRYWEEVAEVLTHMNAEVMDQTSHALGLWVDDAQRTTAELAAGVAPDDDGLLGGAYKAFASAITSATSVARGR